MGGLIQLAIYGAIAVAVAGAAYGAWSGFKGWVAAPYVAEQIAADQKVVNAANANAQAAENERDNAKADTASCVAISAKQTAAIDSWRATAEANALAAKEAKAKAMREATAAAPRIADLQAKAAAVPKLMACEDELGKAKKILQDQLRARRGIVPSEPAGLVK